MSTRKYPSGNEKRKKKKKQEQLTQALSGSLNKYFTSSKSGGSDPMDIVDREEREEEDKSNVLPDKEDNGEGVDMYDLNNWKSVDQCVIDFLVERGPRRVEMEDSEYPRDDSHDKRHFSNVHYTRIMCNGETHDRRWLVYSRSCDKVFCFCCKLFKDKEGDSGLVTTGFRDWHNIGSTLKQHETSREHMVCMIKWIDLERSLKPCQTIDKVVQKRKTVGEVDDRQVFIRVMGAIKWIVKGNVPYSGFSLNADEEDGDTLLDVIEMVAGFDDVMQVYLERRESKEVRYDYLSHEAQIELIQLWADEVRSAILEKIKKAKFFSVILEYPCNQSASLVVRCVNDNDFKVVEYLLGFIKVDDTTGMGLFSELENALSRFGLNIQDIRGQAYGNYVNMKCVQSNLLNINPRAFYATYGCHNLNVAFSDMGKSSPQASDCFGSIQILNNLFSSSTKWWDILKRHVNDLTLEPFSHIRWESDIESVKTIKYNALKIHDALIDLVDSGDSLTRYKAESLAINDFETFDFWVETMIWYEVLTAVGSVSKTLQSEDMHFDVAIDQLKSLIAFFREYREHGFKNALMEAEELAREMDIEPVFCERISVRKNRHVDNADSSEKAMCSLEEKFRSEYFLYMVDSALTLLNEILDQFCVLERNFGFLFDLKKCTDDSSLKSSCENLSSVLSHNGQVDLDVDGLFMELKKFRQILPSDTRGPFHVLNYLKGCNGGFPNMEIAFRIFLTIPITPPSGQESSSKLELVKNYVWNTMYLECVNELAIITLEKDLAEKIDFPSLFDKFASKRGWKTDF